MQIVMDIPEEVLNSIKIFKGKFICKNGYDLIQGIKNSTPLPKGHGDLKDVDNLKHAFVQWSKAVQGSFTDSDIASIVYNSPTIIEADEVEE